MPIIQSGQTLSGIARDNNTTIAALLAANPDIKDANKIYAGKNINIPGATSTNAKAGGTPAASTSVQPPAGYNTAVAAAVAAHPDAQGFLSQGNTAESIANAGLTGDFSGLTSTTGAPFTQAEQDAALAKATAAYAPGFAADAQYAAQNTQGSLAKEQNDYSHFLDTSASDFNTQKQNADTSAAANGVLFSGGRVQQLTNLKNTFDQNQNYQQANTANNITGIANDYAYKYGSPAAANLSGYYNLGGNTYNPNVASGGVGSTGLTSAYNAGTNNYQGTVPNANRINTNIYAAGLLGNQANKLVAGGYNNKL